MITVQKKIYIVKKWFQNFCRIWKRKVWVIAVEGIKQIQHVMDWIERGYLTFKLPCVGLVCMRMWHH